MNMFLSLVIAFGFPPSVLYLLDTRPEAHNSGNLKIYSFDVNRNVCKDSPYVPGRWYQIVYHWVAQPVCYNNEYILVADTFVRENATSLTVVTSFYHCDNRSHNPLVMIATSTKEAYFICLMGRSGFCGVQRAENSLLYGLFNTYISRPFGVALSFRPYTSLPEAVIVTRTDSLCHHLTPNSYKVSAAAAYVASPLQLPPSRLSACVPPLQV